MTASKKGEQPLAEFDYPWIRAWGAYIDATRSMIEEMLARARQEQADPTVLWWYPAREVFDPYWSDELDRWVQTRMLPAYWETLASLAHGPDREAGVTDQRIFLWDWGMARSIHIPDEVLRVWIAEDHIDSSPRW